MSKYLRAIIVCAILMAAIALQGVAGVVQAAPLYERAILLISGLVFLLLIYAHASELIGRSWALLPLLFVAFSPTFHSVLANDARTFGIALAVYASIVAYLEAIFKPSAKNFILAVLGIGAALTLSLQTSILILAILICHLLLSAFTKAGNSKMTFGIIVTAVALSAVALLLIYRPFGPYLASAQASLESAVEEAGLPFPSGFVFGESPASLILIAAAFLSAVIAVAKKTSGVIFGRKVWIWREYLQMHFPEFTLIIFAALWFKVTLLAGNATEQTAYLPMLPALYTLAGSAVRKWFSFEDVKKTKGLVFKIYVMSQELLGLSLKAIFVSALVLWYLIANIISIAGS